MIPLQSINIQEGISTAAFIQAIVSANDIISVVHAFDYVHPPLLQERLTLSTDEQFIASRAKELRRSTSIPFWEALILSCFGEQRNYSRLLEEATFHQSSRDSEIRITRSEVLSGRLLDLSVHASDRRMYSFCSIVETTLNQNLHLPLLDFHCPENSLNDKLVLQIATQLLGKNAFVFASGESYHAIAATLMTPDELLTLLANALLFGPAIDSRYVAHQIINRQCALRLSSSPAKVNSPKLKFVCT